MPLKSLFRRFFIFGPLNFIGRRLYDTVIGAELAVQRALDFIFPGAPRHGSALADEHLTAVVKTFERPQVLRRLVASLRRWYPRLKVIVVDDSRKPDPLEGIETIVMPYDSGISVGRNEALARVTTRYVLILDDDFVFTRHTDLEAALVIMESHPPIDILGGRVVDLPFFQSVDYRRTRLYPTTNEPTLPAGSRIGGLPVLDKVANFFLARTERLRLVPWDPHLKKMEHADFFTQARGVLTTVYDARLRCLHAKTPFELSYRRKRFDLAREYEILQERYYSD
jgi:glycosyltransferase involved in cell wall biosynthesis